MAKVFSNLVYEQVKKIPFGKVATYGQIAELCNSPGAARAVGNALHNNPDPPIIPCHRVVDSKGRLAKNFGFGGVEAQMRRLENEGVIVGEDFRVDLDKYQMK